MALGSLWKKVNRVRNGVAEKRCRCCEKWFPATVDHFHRRKERLHSECRPCANKLAREYQASRYVSGSRRVDRRPEKPQQFDSNVLEQAMRRPA